jgi:hypothetical protein
MAKRKRIIFVKRRENQRLFLSDNLLDIVALSHVALSPQNSV